MFFIIFHCNNFHKESLMTYFSKTCLLQDLWGSYYVKISVWAYLSQGGLTTASWEEEFDFLLEAPCTKYFFQSYLRSRNKLLGYADKPFSQGYWIRHEYTMRTALKSRDSEKLTIINPQRTTCNLSSLGIRICFQMWRTNGFLSLSRSHSKS